MKLIIPPSRDHETVIKSVLFAIILPSRVHKTVFKPVLFTLYNHTAQKSPRKFFQICLVCNHTTQQSPWKSFKTCLVCRNFATFHRWRWNTSTRRLFQASSWTTSIHPPHPHSASVLQSSCHPQRKFNQGTFAIWILDNSGIWVVKTSSVNVQFSSP